MIRITHILKQIVVIFDPMEPPHFQGYPGGHMTTWMVKFGIIVKLKNNDSHIKQVFIIVARFCPKN